MVVLSSFDPVRRQVARLALEMLMKDGRIHPARIEETVEKAQKQIDKEVQRAGEDAVREVGIVDMPPEMVRLLGELSFVLATAKAYCVTQLRWRKWLA